MRSNKVSLLYMCVKHRRKHGYEIDIFARLAVVILF